MPPAPRGPLRRCARRPRRSRRAHPRGWWLGRGDDRDILRPVGRPPPQPRPLAAGGVPGGRMEATARAARGLRALAVAGFRSPAQAAAAFRETDHAAAYRADGHIQQRFCCCLPATQTSNTPGASSCRDEPCRGRREGEEAPHAFTSCAAGRTGPPRKRPAASWTKLDPGAEPAVEPSSASSAPGVVNGAPRLHRF